jgi:hypothetical protein
MQIKWFGASLLVAGTVISQTAAQADVTGGGSKGYGIYVALELIGIPILTIPETAVAQGTSPNPYNEFDQVLSIGVGVPTIASVATGVLEANALSDIDGGLGNRFASSGSLVDDLDIAVIPGTIGPDLLSVTADTIGSGSIVTGDHGSMTPLGDMILENLAISVSGNALNIPIAPAPNTVLFDALGIRIVLNEQFSTSILGSASQVTNAIHIEIDDVLSLGGLVSGDIIIAHSDAQMNSVVPEPATFVGLGGLTLLALLRRRPGRR